MCGIVGLMDCVGQKSFEPTLLQRMNDSQTHRGPDAQGLVLEPGIALGHRRLSIIDIKTGQQPMWSANRQVCLVFNGEIYNYRALKKELIQKGHSFQTDSDTEVLLIGYQQWGREVVHHLRGMFSFAVWDAKNRLLFLARDRLGIKPLYYSMLGQGEFIFASELKGVLAHPKVGRALEPQAVMDYFAFGYVPEPKSIFQGIYKLKPGHTLEVRWGQLTTEQCEYWDVPSQAPDLYDFEEAKALLRHTLSESVGMHLMAEVPLGAFLSGGVDSSVVVATMAQHMNTSVTTCGIGFEEKAFDESDYSQAVAQEYNCTHHAYTLGTKDLQEWPHLTSIYDEPFADSSALPTLKVCEMTKKNVTVALSGDGGDEVFAGYRRYRGHLLEQRLRNLLPNKARRMMFGVMAACYPRLKTGPRFLRAKATFEMLQLNALEGYFNNISLFKAHELKSLMSSTFQRDAQGYDPISVLEHYAYKRQGADDLNLVQYLDMKTYLPGDILTKVDRASMHHSLEVRVPLLDHELIAFAQRLPSAFKVKQSTGKHILKSAFEQELSHDILYRKKQGFAVPLASWFQGPWRAKIMHLQQSPFLHETGYFNSNAIGHLVDLHLSLKSDQSSKLWALCLFEDFLKTQLFEQQEDSENARLACA